MGISSVYLMGLLVFLIYGMEMLYPVNAGLSNLY
jgi:hypothetical protein